MSENLAYKFSNGCWAYDNDTTNVAKYGYLYNYQTALNVCPTGWHLPKSSDIDHLIISLGGMWNGGKLKSMELGNEDKNLSTNSTGFNAVPGGFRSDDGVFSEIGYEGNWWTSTSNGLVYVLKLVNSINVIVKDFNSSEFGISIRCIKNWKSKVNKK